MTSPSDSQTRKEFPFEVIDAAKLVGPASPRKIGDDQGYNKYPDFTQAPSDFDRMLFENCFQDTTSEKVAALR